ncbi:hypothetical protein SLS62_001977 [Diatrype stigma]|uniref:Uncharacterized protein n=1 Tax=Diatrype stigma TaxID=117547 RepID=A0AAN9YVL1_9PEZI
MKSATFTAALLASVAVAQPQHGHQRRHKHQDELEKRELVVEWETVWETATVYVDETTTETVLPEKTPEVESAATTTSTGVPGQFFQTPSEQPTTLATSTSSAAAVAAPPPAETTSEAPPAPSTTSTTSTPQPEPTTAAAPVISVPAIVVPPPVVATTSSPAEEPTTTSSTPPPAETSSSSGGGSGGSTGVSGKGDITYYTVGMGACGYDDTGADDSENIVAMPVGMWTAVSTATNLGVDMPAHPWCDKSITITANGKSIQAKIRDQCPGCSGGSIDVTAHAFEALFGSLDGGRESVEWTMDS